VGGNLTSADQDVRLAAPPEDHGASLNRQERTFPTRLEAVVETPLADERAPNPGPERTLKEHEHFCLRDGVGPLQARADRGSSARFRGQFGCEDLGSQLVLLVACLDRLARDLAVQEAGLAQAWSIDAEVHTCDLGEVRRDDPDDPMSTAFRQGPGVRVARPRPHREAAEARSPGQGCCWR